MEASGDAVWSLRTREDGPLFAGWLASPLGGCKRCVHSCTRYWKMNRLQLRLLKKYSIRDKKSLVGRYRDTNGFGSIAIQMYRYSILEVQFVFIFLHLDTILRLYFVFIYRNTFRVYSCYRDTIGGRCVSLQISMSCLFMSGAKT